MKETPTVKGCGILASTCLVLDGDVHHDEDVVTRLGLGPYVQLHDPEGDARTHALF